MTVARAAALARSRWPWRSRSGCCCSRATAAPSTRCCSRTPASSSRTTTCRSAAAASARSRDIELTDDNQAAIKITVEEPYAPLREGTQAIIRLTSLSGIANRYVALTPAPGDAKELPDGATLDRRVDDRRRRPRPDLQHARREDARRPRGVIQGLATQYEGKGEEAGQSAKYFNPLLSTPAPARQRGHRGRGRAHPLPRELLARGDARSPSAATTSPTSSPTRTRPRGDRRRERRAGAGARAAADHAAPGQHDVRQPARDARRPRRAGRRVQAGDQGPGAVPARAAPADRRRAADDPRPAHGSSRAGPDNDLVDATRKMPQLQRVADAGVPQRPPGAAARPAGARVHPPVHARPRRLVPRLRPGRRQLRRQRPLRAHPADLQRLPVHRQPGRRRAHADPARASASTASRPASSAAARARPPSRPPTARRRSPTRGASTATRAWCRPAHEARRRRRRSCSLAAAAVALVVAGRRRRRRRRLQGPRDLRQRRLRDPGRGRQGRGRQGRHDRLARRHGRLQGRGGPRHHRPGLPGLPRGRRVHRPPAVADRREASSSASRRSRARPASEPPPELEKIEDGPGRGPVPAAGRAHRASPSTST